MVGTGLCQPAKISDAEKSVIKAQGAMWKKDYSEAIKLLTSAISAPDSNEETRAKALQTRARAYDATGNATESKKDALAADSIWDKLIAKEPANGALFFFKGMNLRTLKDFNGSLAALNRSLELSPGNQDVLKEIEETKRLM